MTLTLSDPTGPTLELFGPQTLRNDRQGQVDVSPAIGQDADAAFLTALEQAGEVTIQGAATGPRLSRATGYDSDPITALAEWVAEFEAFVNGAQGDGYDLTRGYRTGDTFRGYISDLEWSRTGGQPHEVGWSLSFVRGEGVGVDAIVAADAVSPGGDYKLDDEVLPNVREFGAQKRQNVNAARRTFATDPGDNDLFSDTGAVRTVQVVGRVVGDADARKAFDDSLTATIGQDTEVDLRDAFTGRTYTGFIRSYEATDEAGRTRLGEYGLEFVEGQG